MVKCCTNNVPSVGSMGLSGVMIDGVLCNTVHMPGNAGVVWVNPNVPFSLSSLYRFNFRCEVKIRFQVFVA